MRGKSIPRIAALGVLLALAAQPVWAETESEEAAEWAEEGRHGLGLFLGVTAKEGDAGPSTGIDYEYRLNEMFGIGGVLELTFADFREGIAGVPIYWHAWRELKLVVAPGIEFTPPLDGTGEFLLRVGGEYGFGAPRGFDIAPALYFDFTSKAAAYVFGATVAKTF
jgi:hypothetical protein